MVAFPREGAAVSRHQSAQRIPVPLRADFSSSEVVRPAAGARLLAVTVDGITLSVLSILVMVGVWFATAPYVPSMTPDINEGGAVESMTGQMPGWAKPLLALVLLLGVLVVSGASRRSTRTSLGLRVAELEFSLACPQRWRIALRWIVPVAVFFAVASTTDAIVGVLVLLVGWAPCLVAPHRSVYDWVAGLTVIDPVATKRRVLAEVRAKSRAEWTAKN